MNEKKKSGGLGVSLFSSIVISAREDRLLSSFVKDEYHLGNSFSTCIKNYIKL